MEKNKRILNFSEFTKQYGKGDPKSAPGNDAKDIDLITNAASELEEPILSGGNEMDSISSGPATTPIKTDYEQAPTMPNGPVTTDSPDKENEEEEEEVKDKPKKKAKSLKKTKEDSDRSEEDKREEAGNY